MLRSWLLLGVLAAASGGCEVTPEERATQACSALCGCEAPPLPGLQAQCVAQCTDEIGTSEITDQCVACVTANSDKCATLEQVCGPACNAVPPDFPVADAGVTPL